MAGRPRIYDNPEDLDKAIEDYFNPEVVIEAGSKCGPADTIKTGKREPIQKPTVTGLALSLGFADKTTLYEYRDRPEFSYLIKRALTRIEQYHEEAMDGNNVAGRIFVLKNMGWKDKVETGFTDNDGKDVRPQFIFNPAPNCNPITDEPGNTAAK